MAKLTNLRVKNIKEAGRYTDGLGLNLVVRKGSLSKSWVLRIAVDGKRRDIGLGGDIRRYPSLGRERRP